MASQENEVSCIAIEALRDQCSGLHGICALSSDDALIVRQYIADVLGMSDAALAQRIANRFNAFAQVSA